MEDFELQLQNAKEEWQQLMDQKEAEANDKLHNELLALENKHVAIQGDLTASRQKQIDDLRNFYSVSMK